ncbi:MAG: hypothetical protein WCN95_10060, partial [bacterium]
MHRCVAKLAAVIALVVACVVNVQAYSRPTIKITSRPVTPRDIKNQVPSGIVTNLPTGTQKSYGLDAIGIGQPSYLEVELTNKTFHAPSSWAQYTNSKTSDTKSITGITWRIVSKPVGSAAVLTASPLTNLTTWPIFEKGERGNYFIPTN